MDSPGNLPQASRNPKADRQQARRHKPGSGPRQIGVSNVPPNDRRAHWKYRVGNIGRYSPWPNDIAPAFTYTRLTC
jgi:hypothetical protein